MPFHTSSWALYLISHALCYPAARSKCACCLPTCWHNSVSLLRWRGWPAANPAQGYRLGLSGTAHALPAGTPTTPNFFSDTLQTLMIWRQLSQPFTSYKWTKKHTDRHTTNTENYYRSSRWNSCITRHYGAQRRKKKYHTISKSCIAIELKWTALKRNLS